MYEIYTPKQWYSCFRTETLTIADDGYIYDNIRRYPAIPMGQIVWETGLIYGNDYNRTPHNPIGKVEYKDGAIVIYGPDYFKHTKFPLFFIKDNIIYNGDDYYKIFPIPSGYVKEYENPKMSANDKPGSSNSKSNNGSAKGVAMALPSAGGGALVILAIVGILIWFGIDNFIELFSGIDPEDNFVRNVVLVAMLINEIVLIFVCIGMQLDKISFGEVFMFSLVMIVISLVGMVLFIDTVAFITNFKDPEFANFWKNLAISYLAGTVVFGFTLLIPTAIIDFVTILISFIVFKSEAALRKISG